MSKLFICFSDFRNYDEYVIIQLKYLAGKLENIMNEWK